MLGSAPARAATMTSLASLVKTRPLASAAASLALLFPLSSHRRIIIMTVARLSVSRWVAQWLVAAVAAVLAGLPAGPAAGQPPPPYPWLAGPVGDTITSRHQPPAGFRRLPAPPGEFAAWLRGLPVKPGRPGVRLHNGALKANQEAHHAVLDIDVGRRDLQQCADAAMRLRAEYLRAAGQPQQICFRFSSGAAARWSQWQAGMRPRIRGNAVTWHRGGTPDESYPAFRRYLDLVFSYAGSFSLAQELVPVADPRRIEAGDVFIKGGFPGHAVIAVDVATDPTGRRAVLLAQSYMPAQDIHVLRNPQTPDNPWYVIDGDTPLQTPEWNFAPGSLRRFSGQGCPPAAR